MTGGGGVDCWRVSRPRVFLHLFTLIFIRSKKTRRRGWGGCFCFCVASLSRALQRTEEGINMRSNKNQSGSLCIQLATHLSAEERRCASSCGRSIVIGRARPLAFCLRTLLVFLSRLFFWHPTAVVIPPPVTFLCAAGMRHRRCVSRAIEFLCMARHAAHGFTPACGSRRHTCTRGRKLFTLLCVLVAAAVLLIRIELTATTTLGY